MYTSKPPLMIESLDWPLRGDSIFDEPSAGFLGEARHPGKFEKSLETKTVEQLVAAWEALPGDSEFFTERRSHVFDALAKRDPEAFRRWLEGDTKASPRAFFLP